MQRYLEFSPRGFVNETAICSVEPSDVAEAQAFIDAAEEPAWARWITYRQAERSTRGERVLRRALERQGLHHEAYGAEHIVPWRE